MTRTQYFRGRLLEHIADFRSSNNPRKNYLVIMCLNAIGGMAGAW